MKKEYLIIILLLNYNLIIGQEKKYPIPPNHKYKFSTEIEEGVAKGKINKRLAAEYYSFIGEYQKALTSKKECNSNWGFDTLTQKDVLYFEKFNPVNAVEAIINQAKKEKIVILNEAHHKSMHRVFIQKLLKGLYDIGYSHFGLEALTNCDYLPEEFCDNLLNERGYPLNSPLSGTYIQEPQMSNLIRKAHEIGFNIFPYERHGKNREIKQAEYISKVLEKDPNTKILILCGFSHILEAEDHKGYKWMAHYVKSVTGIDPFTIYQNILTERNCPNKNPFFNMMDYREEKMFINESGEYYNGKKNFPMFDAIIYHPRTKYINNRPTWLINIEGNVTHKVKNIRIKYPCLIKAYKKDETNEAVPIDVIEMEHEQDQISLVIPKGEYRLEIINLQNEKETREIIIK